MPLKYYLPVILLTLSNIGMTVAWYWHLKFKTFPLWLVILISWGIAFFEYCLAIPANRIGHGVYTAPELKGMQEVITLLVFCVFSIFYLGEKPQWNDYVGFTLIALAACFIFRVWENIPFFRA